MKLLIFLVGFILGGASGIMTMCLVQINRDTEEQLRREEVLNNENQSQDCQQAFSFYCRR